MMELNHMAENYMFLMFSIKSHDICFMMVYMICIVGQTRLCTSGFWDLFYDYLIGHQDVFYDLYL